MIPSETISRIRERVDIVEVIGEYVELRRAGSNFKGLCPFHQEKTPSFNVNQARQMFHCFGCSEGGDVISFLIKYEGRTFSDAVRWLGERVGIEVEEKTPSRGEMEARQRRQAERERLLTVMETATTFYTEQLWGQEGVAARKYLDQRGISRQVAEDFSLGYAPDSWDALYGRLGKLGVSPVEAERLGLIAARKSGRGFYDRFRDRLMFPVADAVGRVIAMSGRVLPGAPSDAPKYVNSPESPLYSKTRTLFALHLARNAWRHGAEPVVVEGNIDVVSLHAHGIRSVVAPLGTALTPEQAGLMRRFAGNEASVVLLFDGDEAGQKAMKRAQPALAEGGLGAKVVLLPSGEDPDSYVRANGAAAIEKLIEESKGLIEHIIDEAARERGGDERAKAQGIHSLRQVISAVRDPLQRDLHKKHLARVFGVPEELVFRYLRGSDPKDVEKKTVARAGGRKKAEIILAGAMLDQMELLAEFTMPSLLSEVQDPLVKWVLKQLPSLSEGGMDVDRMIEGAPDERLAKWMRARLVTPEYEDIDKARKAVLESLARLSELGEREEAQRIHDEVNEAEQEGDEERAARLAQEKLLRAKEKIQRKRTADAAIGGSSGR